MEGIISCYWFLICSLSLSLDRSPTDQWTAVFFYSSVEVVILFREMNLLLVPYWADTQLDLIQWPPFLLASKVCLFAL